MTYAEFLAENGATADEIKVLDVPAARKAYEKQQSLVAAAAAEQQKAADLVKRNQAWATEVETQNQQYLRERDTALANDAANAARLKKLTELGLLQVAENIEPGSTKTTTTEPGVFDPKVLEPYVTRDTLLSVAEQEGNAIATVQDIAYEHQLLFGSDPAKRLNFRALRQEAKERKVPFEQLWSEKYNVPAAREARAAKEKAEYETRIAAEAVTKWRSEHPETNPMLATPTISRTPFTGAVPSSAAKQPWQRSDAEKEQSRQAKVMTSLEKQGLVQ